MKFSSSFLFPQIATQFVPRPISLEFVFKQAQLLICLVLLSPFVIEKIEAGELQQAQNIGEQKLNTGASSQSKIDALAKDSDALLQNYRATIKQAEALRIYNQKLSEQIAHQEQQVLEMEASIKQAKIMSRQVLPMLIEMIDALETFIKEDFPFHAEERAERIGFLRNNLDRSDISIAEKFRQVLEAYKIELEYGQKLDAYDQSIVLFENSKALLAIEVRVLRIGRIALLCQTKDGKRSGAWNPNLQQWQVINNSKIEQSIRHGLRMTQNQAPIDLLSIPLFAKSFENSTQFQVEAEGGLE